MKRSKDEKRKEYMIRAEAANQQLIENDQELEHENIQQVLDDVSDMENIAYHELEESEEKIEKPKYGRASMKDMEDNLEEMYEEKKRIKEGKQKIERDKKEEKKQLKEQRFHIRETKLAPRRFLEERIQRQQEQENEQQS